MHWNRFDWIRRVSLRDSMAHGFWLDRRSNIRWFRSSLALSGEFPASMSWAVPAASCHRHPVVMTPRDALQKEKIIEWKSSACKRMLMSLFRARIDLPLRSAKNICVSNVRAQVDGIFIHKYRFSVETACQTDFGFFTVCTKNSFPVNLKCFDNEILPSSYLLACISSVHRDEQTVGAKCCTWVSGYETSDCGVIDIFWNSSNPELPNDWTGARAMFGI